MDPDRACPHEGFTAEVDVNRLTAGVPEQVAGYSAVVRVQCAGCGERFRFVGAPAGLSSTHPTCSPDEAELRVPIRPASSDPDFGMGLPGFAIRYMPGPTS